MAGFVRIEKGLGPDGRIAVVRFDRGDGINALSPEALRQLTDAARSFEDDPETSVVVLAGNAKAFSAGFDLKDPEGRSRATMDLGTLSGGTNSYAQGTSADGSEIVGYSDTSFGVRAFMWTQASGMTSLERIPAASPCPWPKMGRITPFMRVNSRPEQGTPRP